MPQLPEVGSARHRARQACEVAVTNPKWLLCSFVLLLVACGKSECQPPPQGTLILGERPAHWDEWDEKQKSKRRDERSAQAQYDACLQRQKAAR